MWAGCSAGSLVLVEREVDVAPRRWRGVVSSAFAVTGGVMSALAQEPWALGWLAPVGVALLVGPVLGAATGRHGRSAAGRAAALGALHAGVAAGLVLFWLWEAIAPAAWAGLVVVHAAWGAVLGVGVVAVRSVPGRSVWIASVWTTVEVARSTWPFGGLPWGRLAHTALDTPWQDLLGWAGLTGTSWVIALVGCGLAVTGRPGRGRCGAAGLVLAAALGVLALPAGVGSGQDRVARVAVVQPGVPGGDTDLAAHHRVVTDRLAAGTTRLAGSSAFEAGPVDLVLWPESATAVDPFRDSRAAAAIEESVRVAGVPVVAGSVVAGPVPGTLENTSVVWAPDGDDVVAFGRYVKHNLVPFGEYVPVRALAERLSSRVSDVPIDMVSGRRAEPLRVGGLRLAVALCFDVAYRDPLALQVRQGADLVVVQTSNATFSGTTQPDQQWAITRARAVELGRSVVVSSTTGVSGAIGPDGAVLARFAPGGPVGAVLAVPLRTSVTPATRAGAWPEGLAVLLAGGGVAAAAVRRARRLRAVRRRRAGVVCH